VAAVASGKQLLQHPRRTRTAHHGLGASNPSFAGVYNWNSLDRRVQLMRDTGGVPVLTLCCAPAGCARPASRPTGTTWRPLPRRTRPGIRGPGGARGPALPGREVLPGLERNEGHVGHGAGVHAVGLRPEPLGLRALHHPLYAIYDAVKAVRPDAQLGGLMWSSHPTLAAARATLRGEWPYGVLDQRPLDVIKYWLANKHGGEFITLDGGRRRRTRCG